MAGPVSHYPVDSRYSWLVAILGAFIYSLVLGQTRAFGIIIVELKEALGIPDDHSMRMLGLPPGLILAAGPLCGILINVINHRNVMLLGGLMVVVSLLMIAFITNYYYLYIAFTLAGIGMNFSFLPTLVVTSHYFVKQRTFALGITASGCGLGTFYYPPIVRALLDNTSPTETLVYLAGLFLHMAPAAMFLCPEESWMRVRSGKKKDGTSGARGSDEKLELHEPSDEVTPMPVRSSGPLTENALDEADTHSSSGHASERVSHHDFFNHLSPDSMLGVKGERLQSRKCSSTHGSRASALDKIMVASDMCINTLSDLEDEEASADVIRPSLYQSMKLLFTNRTYLIYMFACMIVTMGYSMIYTIIPFYALETNVSKQHVAYAIAATGAIETVSRPVHGYLAGRKWVTALVQVGVSVIGAALSMLFIISCSQVPFYYLTGIGLGVFTAVIVPLVPVVLLERFDPHTTSIGIGFIYGLQGLSALSSFTIAPLMQERSGTWQTCLWFVLGVMLLSGIISLVTGILSPTPSQKFCKCALQVQAHKDIQPN